MPRLRKKFLRESGMAVLLKKDANGCENEFGEGRTSSLRGLS
jgi:hypothetical protein